MAQMLKDIALHAQADLMGMKFSFTQAEAVELAESSCSASSHSSSGNPHTLSSRHDDHRAWLQLLMKLKRKGNPAVQLLMPAMPMAKY